MEHKTNRFHLQKSKNSFIVPFSKLGDKVATCRRNGRVANCSSASRVDFEELEILSLKQQHKIIISLQHTEQNNFFIIIIY